ncbi:MAG TPA: hypothetical protein PLG21_15795, partial [Anaerolineae bacterium]|nr:hypothetical protein [Anaerolineae bacterium]
MKDALNDLQGKLPSGDRLYSLLAACTIAAIIVAYGLIAARGLVPSIRAWMDLSAQVAAADAALAKAREAQALAPGAAERRRAAAEAALAQAAGILLSEGQAAEMPTRLYEYAGASGVEIVSLQSQPVQKGAADDVYSVRVLDVQIAGPLAGLIHCLSRIDEGALPGCVISGVSIVEHGDAKHLLR